MDVGGYMKVFSIYVSSMFQDFESFLRTEFELVEDDIRLVLEKYNSSFITYALEPGVYSFKGFSRGLSNILQPE